MRLISDTGILSDGIFCEDDNLMETMKGRLHDAEMKRVLVIYYSQSGQLFEIAHSVLSPLKEIRKVSLHFAEIKTGGQYSYPWNYMRFFDVFPESALGIPDNIAEIDINPDEDFDLIILAYQVWYLSPSVPISTFLQSAMAKKLMKGKPVITLIAARNMWLMAQEKVKRQLDRLGTRLVGNIALVDRHRNLVSAVTMVYWMMSGKKDRFLRLLPVPGVAEADIKASRKFGDVILDRLMNGRFDTLQNELQSKGAVMVIPYLIMLEKRANRIFRVWATFIRRKGGYGNPNRRFRVKLFSYYLMVAISFLPPIIHLNSRICQFMNQKRLKKDIEYYSGTSLCLPVSTDC
jgi:hypothetical protein